MRKIDMLATQIEDLKVDLEHLVEEETELVKPEVVRMSEALDEILIQYYKLVNKRKKNH